MSNTKLHPIWPAIASIFVTPIAVGTLLLSAALILISWPLAPIIIYREKKKQYLISTITKSKIRNQKP